MAIVCMPINGVGYGHLRRMSMVARWLRRGGERPVIFYQGKYPAALAARIPGISLLPLYRLPPQAVPFAVNQIASYARLSEPSIVIEDTHPAPVQWPEDLTRVLVLRPTTFQYLEELRAAPQPHDAVLLCDHPDSPTWPYDAAQTAAIQQWPRWHIAGPIFHRAQPGAIDAVKRRYDVGLDQQIVVFTMGGGGEQPGSGDRVAFIERSAAIASAMRERHPSARMLFVRGPLFPADLELPTIFESIATEADMPALIAAAHGVVMRPGFNATWECLAGGTPFLPISGTTFAEPVEDRLRRLRDRGVTLTVDPEQWWDREWRRRFAAECATILDRHDGAPAATMVDLVKSAERVQPPPTAVLPRHGRAKWFQDAFASVDGSKRSLIVRIDDIVAPAEPLSWVAAACAERRVPLSLEVIPYFATITAADVDRLDRDGLLEVSQHGFAHLPAGLPGRMRGEFFNDRRQPSPVAARLLRRGRRLLTRRFGDRFRGGYSAPYDTWPDWLAREWRGAGGAFVSWMFIDPAREECPSVRMPIDPWDWQRNEHRSEADLTDAVIAALAADHRAGLVLHPQCLTTSAHRAAFEDLLDALLLAGCEPAAVSATALAARQD